MKIVGSDNLARESVADTLWLDGIPEQCRDFAGRICDQLNKDLGDGEGVFYKVVEDDYRLWRGMEELV